MSATTAALEPRQLIGMLAQMQEIRMFEEEIQRLFTENMVRGSTHLCNGQEATAVGACGALREGDSMVCTYRGHGAVLAMGAPLDRTFGEILGKAEGLCGGKGGSMHLTDVEKGAYGSFAIVGAHLPIATGLAFAARYEETGAATLCFFGDGSTNIGAFHESLNMASIWKLPVVFFCENNLYGEYSALSLTTPIEELSERAKSYGMPGERVDGNDVAAVHEAVAAAVERARAGEGPTLIEGLTYRHKGHSRTDPGTYRPAAEVEEWLARDPIKLLEARLAEGGTPAAELDAVRERSGANVAAALERARGWPEPPVEARFEDVLA